MIQIGSFAKVHSHVCAELLNAVCENDARRAKALLAVLPEVGLLGMSIQKIDGQRIQRIT